MADGHRACRCAARSSRASPVRREARFGEIAPLGAEARGCLDAGGPRASRRAFTQPARAVPAVRAGTISGGAPPSWRSRMGGKAPPAHERISEPGILRFERRARCGWLGERCTWLAWPRLAMAALTSERRSASEADRWEGLPLLSDAARLGAARARQPAAILFATNGLADRRSRPLRRVARPRCRQGWQRAAGPGDEGRTGKRSERCGGGGSARTAGA